MNIMKRKLILNIIWITIHLSLFFFIIITYVEFRIFQLLNYVISSRINELMPTNGNKKRQFIIDSHLKWRTSAECHFGTNEIIVKWTKNSTTELYCLHKFNICFLLFHDWNQNISTKKKEKEYSYTTRLDLTWNQTISDNCNCLNKKQNQIRLKLKKKVVRNSHYRKKKINFVLHLQFSVPCSNKYNSNNNNKNHWVELLIVSDCI